jgi:uncharacterized protein YjbI with pentapeptide repeats
MANEANPIQFMYSKVQTGGDIHNIESIPTSGDDYFCFLGLTKGGQPYLIDCAAFTKSNLIESLKSELFVWLQSALSGAGIETTVKYVSDKAVALNKATEISMATDSSITCKNISGSAISGSSISGTSVSAPTISGANISGTTLAGVNISGTNISGVSISGTNISGSTLNSTGIIRSSASGVAFYASNASGKMYSRGGFYEQAM